MPNTSVYAYSKAGIASITRVVTIELNAYALETNTSPIRVNAVLPGVVRVKAIESGFEIAIDLVKGSPTKMVSRFDVLDRVVFVSIGRVAFSNVCMGSTY